MLKWSHGGSRAGVTGVAQICPFYTRSRTRDGTLSGGFPVRRSRNIWLGILGLGVLIAGANGAGAAEKADPTGTWKWERTRNDRTIVTKLKLKLEKGKVTGFHLRGEDQKTKIEEGKLDGDKLSFRVTRERNDQKFTIKYSGKVTADSIKGEGEFSFGDRTRTFEWEAKRATEIVDVIGTWKLKIERGDGEPIEPTLKLSKNGDKLKGIYNSRFGEIEAKDVILKDNMLSFTISRETDNGSFTVKYKGKPIGRAIKGSLDYKFGDNGGSADFEGKLLVEKKKKKKKEKKKETL